MTIQIQASVGKFGRNNVDDVVAVQRLLTQQGVVIGPVDGLCGRRTIAGITLFQTAFLAYPDGLVEPGGKTIQRLNMVHFRPPVSSAVAPKMVPLTEINRMVPAEIPMPITKLVSRDSLGKLNPNLEFVKNDFLIQHLGMPRARVERHHLPVTNLRLLNLITTTSVGPFKATGLRPAIKSLQEVMKEVLLKYPTIYSALRSDGMLCCRLMKNSQTKISNHSWGTAIDLKFSNVSDRWGDGKVLYGLALIAPIFNAHGWYWGGGFNNKEDGMHFEVSRNLLEKWLPFL